MYENTRFRRSRNLDTVNEVDFVYSSLTVGTLKKD